MKIKDQSELLLLEQDQMDLSAFLAKLKEESIKITNHEPFDAFGTGIVDLKSYFFKDGSTITTDGENFSGLPSKETLLRNMAMPTNSYLN